jgi:hypothetical protein
MTSAGVVVLGAVVLGALVLGAVVLGAGWILAVIPPLATLAQVVAVRKGKG